MGRYDNFKYFDGTSFVKPKQLKIYNGESFVDFGEDESSIQDNFKVKYGDTFINGLKRKASYPDSDVTHRSLYGKIETASDSGNLFCLSGSNSNSVRMNFKLITDMILHSSETESDRNIIKLRVNQLPAGSVLTGSGNISVVVNTQGTMTYSVFYSSTSTKTGTIVFPTDEKVHVEIAIYQDTTGYTFFVPTITRDSGEVLTETIKVPRYVCSPTKNSFVLGCDYTEFFNVVKMEHGGYEQTPYISNIYISSLEEGQAPTNTSRGSTISSSPTVTIPTVTGWV